jgi:hypothetical protein
MKYLILIVLFASGLYAQQPQQPQQPDGFPIQEYVMKYSKEIECVNKTLGSPAVKAKFQVIIEWRR